MNGAFYIGATGLEMQQRGLDAIAQNVANVNTDGFKRIEMRFAQLSTSAAAPGVPRPEGAGSDPAGIGAAGMVRSFSQGGLRQTGRPLDVAIDGDGFVEVLGPNGQTYLWRAGTLKIGEERQLATGDGLALKAAIDIPDDATELRIERDGRVRALVDGEVEPVELGKLDLVMPGDLARLEPVDGGYFSLPDDAELRSFVPGEEGKGVFVQGSLEASNVELTTELVGLLLAQRAYGANAQVVQAGDQLMAIANGLRR